MFIHLGLYGNENVNSQKQVHPVFWIMYTTHELWKKKRALVKSNTKEAQSWVGLNQTVLDPSYLLFTADDSSQDKSLFFKADCHG